MIFRHRTARLTLCATVLAFVAALAGTSTALADAPTAWTSSGVATKTVPSDGTTG